ncbi:hypothetical protein LL251_10195 [Sphingobium naphthae]|nr:hypothetical protein [Sphingobium naphthae]
MGISDIAYSAKESGKSITDICYLTSDCIGGSARYDNSMGRPPLGVKTTVVRLPEGLAERIDALLGPNRRAVFIREVVEREVERLEREQPKI